MSSFGLLNPNDSHGYRKGDFHKEPPHPCRIKKKAKFSSNMMFNYFRMNLVFQGLKLK